MSSSFSCTVLIPAAGSGSRFGGALPKQFAILRGEPVISHAIRRFEEDAVVRTIYVAIDPSVQESFEHIARSAGWSKVQTLNGGASRQDSVIAALTAASLRDDDLVAVHDAVRPFFSRATFHQTLEAAAQYGAALPLLQPADTIHEVEEGRLIRTLARERLGAAQTPQCFRAGLLGKSLAAAARNGIVSTDEAAAVLREGYEVRAIPGDPLNFKITWPGDLQLAEARFEWWEEE